MCMCMSVSIPFFFFFYIQYIQYMQYMHIVGENNV